VAGAQILSAYFVVLPLRDEGAISLGLDTLPSLFAGSLLLTVLAAPVASLAFSLPSIPKPRVRPCYLLPFPTLAVLFYFIGLGGSTKSLLMWEFSCSQEMVALIVGEHKIISFAFALVALDCLASKFNCKCITCPIQYIHSSH
jgi:hypothetical protein